MWEKKKHLLMAAIFLLTLAFTGAPVLAQRQGGGEKPAESLKDAKPKKGGKIKVAVIPQSKENEWTKDITVASLEDALVSGGRFTVLSRSELDSVLKEQKFSNSDLVDPAAAVSIGKALAAQYVIIAKCVSLENKQGGFNVGGFGQKTNTMNTTLQMQLIDTETTQIMESKSYTGKAETKSSQVGGYGSSSADAPGQESYRKIIEGFAKDFAEKLSLAVPIETVVLQVKNNQVVLEGGTDKAITQGLEFEIIEEGEPIKDSSGKVVSHDITKIGLVRVTNVEASIARCEIVQTFDPASGAADGAPNASRIQRGHTARQVAKVVATTPPPKKK